ASSGIAAASKPASTPRPASAASTTSWSEEFHLSGKQLDRNRLCMPWPMATKTF
ncbi:unnamed protein product, partial [Rotaria magnacalcarata]